MTFTSSSTVRNFAKSSGTYPLSDLMKGIKVASIGPVTSETLRELGLQVDIEPEEITIPALVEAIGAYFSESTGGCTSEEKRGSLERSDFIA